MNSSATNTKASPLKLPLGPLMVDLEGQTPCAEELDFLRHPAVGAVILFARNYQSKSQLSELVDEIKAVRTPSLLVAVDQEGGRVQRFSEEFYQLPAAGDIGKVYASDRARGLEMAEAVGQLMASEVLQTGVDFSFAPVLDCQDPQSQVIGDRAFHRDPAQVCELANAYIAGMNRAGMAATGKHFPGHGCVLEDSHIQLPVATHSIADLEERDLLPFRQLAKSLGGIMTAHVLFEKIDELLPAYSEFWLQQILRKKLHFNGVIFSDDLSMKGADTETDSPPHLRGDAALKAGCDMILVCNDPENARRTADHIGQDYSGDTSCLLSMKAKKNTNSLVSLASLIDKMESLARG